MDIKSRRYKSNGLLVFRFGVWLFYEPYFVLIEIPGESEELGRHKAIKAPGRAEET